jgi:hypothetical protein
MGSPSNAAIPTLEGWYGGAGFPCGFNGTFVTAGSTKVVTSAHKSTLEFPAIPVMRRGRSKGLPSFRESPAQKEKDGP